MSKEDSETSIWMFDSTLANKLAIKINTMKSNKENELLKMNHNLIDLRAYTGYNMVHMNREPTKIEYGDCFD